MNAQEYTRFTARLGERLAGDERVLGLVALGSMAAQDTQPDRWSDHDFFVIVRTGAQEMFRRDLSWLPEAEDLALSYRETAHGLKALYRNGHLPKDIKDTKDAKTPEGSKTPRDVRFVVVARRGEGREALTV